MNLTKGTDLEDLVLERLDYESKAGNGTGGRYGVKAVYTPPRFNGDNPWKIIKSYPDIEGVLVGGRQWICECKVRSGSSFSLADDKFTDNQYRHLRNRGRLGVVSFILIHFNERELTKEIDPAQTWAVPVAPGMALWEQFESGELRSLSRSACAEQGERVEWTILPGQRKARPDILEAVRRLRHRFQVEVVS